ncbi:MAG: type III secretion system export apparatus subunit SctR [Gammaproteobacteria bacterium]|nr:type III secretion system export apparatus subunit SctR [Gammaproteobacteria bacterium]MDE0513495.1 type III secretion system export apparatus subunit SctR [Gammaproteobacteria bacterium]
MDELISPGSLPTIVITLALVGLMPIIVSIGTAFLKFVVVFSLLKNAIGIQQIPPTIVVNSLAMIIAAYIMAPVFIETYELAQGRGVSLADGSFLSFMAGEGAEPYRRFLQHNTSQDMIDLFRNMALELWPENVHHRITDDNLFLLLPAFTLTELKEAFEIGFIIYVPFIVVDIVVSNILLAMGMMMMSPMTISLPFKLLLFVFVDGWTLLLNNLALTYS